MNQLIFAAAFVALATLVTAAPGFAQQANTGTAANAAAHYEWQYHYVGHHPHYQGYWAVVR